MLVITRGYHQFSMCWLNLIITPMLGAERHDEFIPCFCSKRTGKSVPNQPNIDQTWTKLLRFDSQAADQSKKYISFPANINMQEEHSQGAFNLVSSMYQVVVRHNPDNANQVGCFAKPSGGHLKTASGWLN